MRSKEFPINLKPGLAVVPGRGYCLRPPPSQTLIVCGPTLLADGPGVPPLTGAGPYASPLYH